MRKKMSAISNIKNKLEKELYSFKHRLTENADADVLEAVLDLASAIGRERDEKWRTGTAFVIGKKADLLKHTKPLLKKNPLRNIPINERNIKNVQLHNSLKEMAFLDGVFLIGHEGTIIKVAAYIDHKKTKAKHNQLGRRHMEVAALTELAGVTGVVVSRRDGMTRIFKEGKQVMKLY